MSRTRLLHDMRVSGWVRDRYQADIGWNCFLYFLGSGVCLSVRTYKQATHSCVLLNTHTHTLAQAVVRWERSMDKRRRMKTWTHWCKNETDPNVELEFHRTFSQEEHGKSFPFWDSVVYLSGIIFVRTKYCSFFRSVVKINQSLASELPWVSERK